MSAKAGWYPDPGGVPNLFRYWDGRAWSAATSPHPQAPPPPGLVGTPAVPTTHGQTRNAYANYQQVTKRKSAAGWWIAGAALLVVLVVIGVVAVRALNNGLTANPGGANPQPSADVCPRPESASALPQQPQPNDGRVHGGPVSYPELGQPWSSPGPDFRVPFGRDVQEQIVTVEPNYQPGSNWVASVLVGELQGGDGFFTPQQGAQIVVRCILGTFYGDAEVTSDVKVNKAATIDGHDGWLVESHLSFDIPGLRTKGELLIVAIVSAGATAGLYYASIPDTTPELVAPARQALAQLSVDA